MLNIEYLEEFMDFIDSKEDANLSKEYRKALECYQELTPEKFTSKEADYNGRPDEFLLACLGMVTIHIFPETTMDIGEDTTDIQELGEDYYFDISDVFSKEVYIKDDFYVKSKGEFYVNPEVDDGEIADYLSNTTGFCVQNLQYELF